MNVVIIKYNAGNIHSVRLALNRLKIEPVVSDDANVIESADKVIFPGVGEASSAMNYLNTHNLANVIKGLKQPFLGICLGLQLMCNHSQENDTGCLKLFDTDVLKFPPVLKVPHIGWNSITGLISPLFKDIPEKSFVYFVHSYYAGVCDNTIARTEYSLNFSAALQLNNYFAVQFHPEKSGEVGANILNNFIQL